MMRRAPADADANPVYGIARTLTFPRMKIGLVLERFDPHRGGLEHWTWQFARQLLDRGHEVHIVAFEFHPAALELYGAAIMHLVEKMPRSRVERAAMLADRLRSVQLDVIHDLGCGWYADIFHLQGGSTVALWEHNLMRIPRWRQIRFWRERRYREMAEVERRQLANTNAVVVTVSRMVQRHFTTLHHVPPGQMRLIYNGVDVQRFSPTHRERHRGKMRTQLGVEKGEVLFLMLAHNLLLKNAATVIRAVAQLRAAGHSARAAIVGGKRPDQFIRLARRLDVADTISFLEAVDDPVPFFSAADVFVHPTWYDPCSLVALEALASGLPVITTNFDGVGELIAEGQEGYVLEKPADVAALTARMEALIKDASHRETVGGAARQLALEHSFARQTEEFLALYEEVARKKQPRT
jgi:UDP-glucose:(heptosyl)LPS alpha-1,3-glucosyltransferase